MTQSFIKPIICTPTPSLAPTPSPVEYLKLSFAFASAFAFLNPKPNYSSFHLQNPFPQFLHLSPNMSINHFSSDHPETQWWPNTAHQQQQDPSRPHFLPQFYQDTHHHNYQAWLNSQEQPTPMSPTPPTPTTLNFNLNQNDAESDHANQLQHHLLLQSSPPLDDHDEENEPMFEKPLTPSDVGKLNRLVIPKQHAEKYFPLGGGDSGLLLSFEDESGKSWRFRYSYWNSSQSYVLTKGWSRYVKEKRLDAGDVVLFERRRSHTDRLFIGWRRRSAAATPSAHDSGPGATQVNGGAGESSGSGSAGGWTRMFYSAPHHNSSDGGSSYPAHQYHNHSAAPYPPDCLHAAGNVYPFNYFLFFLKKKPHLLLFIYLRKIILQKICIFCWFIQARENVKTPSYHSGRTAFQLD